MTDGNLFWVGEVYYDKKGNPDGFTNPMPDLLTWGTLADLEGTTKLVALAAQKPVLYVDGDRISEKPLVGK
jgi:hypothetical protein